MASSRILCLENFTSSGSHFTSILMSLSFSAVTSYASEAALVEAYNQDTTNKIWAGVVFLGDFTSGWPANINYKLRVALRKGQEDRDRWRTDRTYVFFSTFGYRNNATEGGQPCKCFKTFEKFRKLL